eukprot:764280-Hanusia_phi.AAC.8
MQGGVKERGVGGVTGQLNGYMRKGAVEFVDCASWERDKRTGASRTTADKPKSEMNRLYFRKQN